MDVNLPFFGQYYGGGWPCFANGETEMQERPVTCFFYAEASGIPKGLQMTWRQSTLDPGGYSNGDGGQYTIQIVEADSRTKKERPGGEVRAEIRGIKPGNPKGSSSMYRQYEFETAERLAQGRPYVFKFTNTHRNPQGNFVSVNVNRDFVWYERQPQHWTEPGGGGAVGQIRVASGGIRGHEVGAEPAIVKGYSPHSITWDDGSTSQQFPVPLVAQGSEPHSCKRLGGFQMSLVMEDGTVTLWGRGSGTYPQGRVRISSESRTHIRQRFRVTRASRTVSGVFVRTYSDGSLGELVIQLEAGPETDDHFPKNGEVIEKVTIPAALFLDTKSANLAHNQYQTGSPKGPLDLVHYVWIPFSKPQTLELGKTYNLRLRPKGCNVYMIGGARPDDKYGVYGRTCRTWEQWENGRRLTWTAFEDSRGPQVSEDSGKTWGYWPAGQQHVPITFKCIEE